MNKRTKVKILEAKVAVAKEALENLASRIFSSDSEYLYSLVVKALKDIKGIR